MKRKNLAVLWKHELESKHAIGADRMATDYSIKLAGSDCILDLVVFTEDGNPLVFIITANRKPLPVAKVQRILEGTDFSYGFVAFCPGGQLSEIYGLEKDALAGFINSYREIPNLPVLKWLDYLAMIIKTG